MKTKWIRYFSLTEATVNCEVAVHKIFVIDVFFKSVRVTMGYSLVEKEEMKREEMRDIGH